MLKVVKSRVYNIDTAKPVALGEPLPAPVTEDKDAEKELTPEEIERLRQQEIARKLEEETRRFNEAVIKRSDDIIEAKRRQIEAEAQRVIGEAEREADRLLSDAKSKTKAVFDAANEECERLKELSRKEGFEAGFESGRTEAMKKCEKYLEAAAKLLAEINAKKEAYYISNEYELCETVMDMVRKITLAEIKTDPEVIDRICKNAAKNFRNSDYLKISVSKGEASARLVSDAQFVKSLIPFIPEIEIEELEPEDAPEGTVVLDNGSEIIDASVPTQLEFLKEILRSSSHSEETADEE